jgi:hypothetical protein
MRTYKNKNSQKKRRKTIKGGTGPNEKAFVVVRKSRLDNENTDLLYKLIIARPAFPFLDYLNYNMNLVDEGLAEIRPKDPKVDDNGNIIKEEENIVFIKKIEIGNNKTKNVKEIEKANTERKKEENEEE